MGFKNVMYLTSNKREKQTCVFAILSLQTRDYQLVAHLWLCVLYGNQIDIFIDFLIVQVPLVRTHAFFLQAWNDNNMACICPSGAHKRMI